MKEMQVVCFSSISSISGFRSSGSQHSCDDLFIVPWERTGDRSHVEPPYSTDPGHDLYGPSLSWEGGQRIHPKGTAGGSDVPILPELTVESVHI